MEVKVGNLLDNIESKIKVSVEDKEIRKEILDDLYEIREINKEMIYLTHNFLDCVEYGIGMGKVGRAGCRLENFLIDYEE